jgi:hypothetical protein
MPGHEAFGNYLRGQVTQPVPKASTPAWSQVLAESLSRWTRKYGAML